MPYVAPVERLAFHIAHRAPGALDGAPPLAAEDIAGILGEAARFAEAMLAPLNATGDRLGARYHPDGRVEMPPGFEDAYRAWSEGGWNGVTMAETWGGMALPTALGIAAMEIWTSACMAFGVGVLLTLGAVELLTEHASEELKRRYLPSLVQGQWTATMALTEPQAGSDLGALRTQAIPQADGSYRLRGSKIFITFGEHGMTENIVHLVLARIKDAPEGTRGISLFLVPKFLPDAAGAFTVRNDVRCTGIEHKMGIHASPTCALSFGDDEGATGWLVGQENQGLAAMFTMMNRARLGTGMQGVAVAERAMQKADAYARMRIQGRTPDGARDQPIRGHPDVRRMLETMACLTSAGRALGHAAADAIEAGATAADPAARRHAEDQAALLTPMVKAYGAEIGVTVSSIAMQVHGGMGYVEETGAAQFYRDARITPIYEGTNGIQAIDLALRKVRKDGGAAAHALIARLRAIARAAAARPALAPCAGQLSDALDMLAQATATITAEGSADTDLLWVATPYLQLFARAAAGGFLIEQAALACAMLDEAAPLRAALIREAHMYGWVELGQCGGLAAIVTAHRPDPLP